MRRESIVSADLIDVIVANRVETANELKYVFHTYSWNVMQGASREGRSKKVCASENGRAKSFCVL